MSAEALTGPVLYFDGVCNLCNGTVQFIIRNDRRGIFKFAPLQSPRGEAIMRELRTDRGTAQDSVILQYRGHLYTKSDAALKVARLLGGAWALLQAGYILPAFIRNRLYDVVARNRYRWFGKQQECMIPTPELKSRFLTD